MKRFVGSLRGKYAPLNEDSDSIEEQRARTNCSSNQRFILLFQYTVCALLTVLLSGYIGFWLGSRVQPVALTRDYNQSVSHNRFHSEKLIYQTFDYNDTFSRAPSSETNEAWYALFPKGMGYITTITNHHEGVAGVSAFHQIHCVDLLRHLYYAAELGTNVTDTYNRPAHLPHHHARHCFDYLRRSLMCAADSNLEPVDERSKAVIGKGVVHQCRNFDGLVRWTEERRVR